MPHAPGRRPRGIAGSEEGPHEAWRRIKSILAAEQRLSLARESFNAEILDNAATILVDNGDLTLALGTKPGYLELKAIIWADGISRFGRNAKGERIGDSSALIFDLDSDGARTAELDRTYYLNPWPSRRGVFYVTELGGGRSTTLRREQKLKEESSA